MIQVNRQQLRPWEWAATVPVEGGQTHDFGDGRTYVEGEHYPFHDGKKSVPSFSSPAQLGPALEALVVADLLELSNQNVARWSPSGAYLAKQWRNRLGASCLHVLAADPEGNPVSHYHG
jgi:hypothetical protein